MPFGSRYGVIPHLRGRIAELRDRLVRARYFRGHGVHSPFVYAIVRHVFMSSRLIGEDTSLRDALHDMGVNRRRARELQNLMNYCGYRTFAIYGAGAELVKVRSGFGANGRREETHVEVRSGFGANGRREETHVEVRSGFGANGGVGVDAFEIVNLPEVEFSLLLCEADESTMRGVIAQAAQACTTVVVMTPHANAQRHYFCLTLVSEHQSTSVDNRGYLLIFNNKRLPKQHYRI